MNHLETAGLVCCVYEAISGRQQSGRPIPEWMRALEEKLAAEVRLHEELLMVASELSDVPMSGSMSGAGHSAVGDASECFVDKRISAAEAAQMIGCCSRHVTRIDWDLGGVKVAGRWTFSEVAVREYAEWKERNAA